MSPAPILFPVAGLDDGVVCVRLIADADLPGVVEACNDPEIARYTTVPAPYGPEDARAWQSGSSAGLLAGTDLATVVIDAVSAKLLGSVGLHNIDPVSGRCSAGYWVRPEERGRGVARRALRMLCRFGFEELAVKRIELWIEPENIASLRVAESCGFVREGLLRSYMAMGGRRRDMLMYSLLPGEPD